MDIHSKEIRSKNMAAIKSKNTKPEMTIRKNLYELGFRYRIHNKNIPGKPDISNVSKKIAIFVNGCFWHYHKNCKYSKLPKTRKHDFNLSSVDLNPENIKGFDVILIAADHDIFDYKMIEKHAKMIVDTRGVFQTHNPKIIMA